MKPDRDASRSFDAEFSRTSRLDHSIRRILIRVLADAHQNRCATARDNRDYVPNFVPTCTRAVNRKPWFPREENADTVFKNLFLAA